MTPHFLKIVALCAGILAGSLSAAPTRIALIAGPDSHGWGAHQHHAVIGCLAEALRDSGLEIQADVYLDQWPADLAQQQDLRSIVLYCDGEGDHLLNGHEKEIAELSKRGIGFVCLHYALDVDRATLGAPLLDWLGGCFEPGWSVNPTWKPINVTLANHPVTHGIAPFEIRDEWYFHMRFRPNMEGVTPVLSALPPAHTVADDDGPRTGNPAVRKALAEGQPQHLAWVSTNAHGARAFGLTGGHAHRNWAHDDLRGLVLNAIVWTAGLDVPEKGVPSETPVIVKHKTLKHAVARGDAEDTERHIRLGAKVDEATKAGWQPLHYAVLRNKVDVAKVLIKHGADVNAQTGKKNSSLTFCAERGYVDMAKLLLDSGADLGIGDQDGWTPLHTAAARDQLEIVALFLTRGADVNALSTRGGTPLHEGAAGARPEIIRLLLKHGARKNAKATNGKTPLDYAIELGNDKAAEILREK